MNDYRLQFAFHDALPPRKYCALSMIDAQDAALELARQLARARFGKFGVVLSAVIDAGLSAPTAGLYCADVTIGNATIPASRGASWASLRGPAETFGIAFQRVSQ